MIVTTLRKLFEQGKYQEVIDQLALEEIQEQLAALTVDKQIECYIYQGRAFLGLGRFETAYQVTSTALAKFLSPDDRTLVLALLSVQISALGGLGRMDEQQEVNNDAEVILERLTEEEHLTGTRWIAYFLENKGFMYGYTGKLDDALACFHQSLTLREQLGNSSGIARSAFLMGDVYRRKFDLETALGHFQRSLKLYETVGDPVGVASALRNIGDVYLNKGQLDKSLAYFQKSLKSSEETNHYASITSSLFFIGIAYYYKGELDTSLTYLQRSLNISEKAGDGFGVSESSFFLIRLALDQQDQVTAESHLTRLQQLLERTTNKWIHLYSRLAEALILKLSPRMKNKVRAQNLLEEIVQEDILHFYFTALATIHLCDLLIFEAGASGDPGVWKEATALIHQLHAKAQDYRSFHLVGEALLLLAKVAAIEGDLQQAQEYFKQARTTVTDNNIGQLLQKVDIEQKRFEAEFIRWQGLIQNNASLQERLTFAKMDEYLQKAQKIVDLMKD